MVGVVPYTNLVSDVTNVDVHGHPLHCVIKWNIMNATKDKTTITRNELVTIREARGAISISISVAFNPW